MTPQEFVAKWRRTNLSERSACQQHFLDLCEVLGQPKPAAADPDGEFYTFERGVTKTEGGHGWADVWMRGHFGWEYKGKHKDLAAAYRQLQLYREDLENPPLLVVCDMDRFEIHTNFTGTAKYIYVFDLDGLAKPENLDTLRKLFTEPESLRPGQTAIGITEETANLFGRLADGMRVRGIPAHAAAHFLMKLMFCMFGEKIDLLPDKVFSSILNSTKIAPTRLSDRLRALFTAMAKGGDFGPVAIPYFNGGLFSDDEVFDLSLKEIEELIAVNAKDWANVEPSIFGTLFERTLDPDKRAQIGAHYTSRADILTLLEPVVMTPLRRKWDAVRAKCDKLWDKLKADVGSERPARGKTSKPRKDHDKLLRDFVEHLAHVTILDPACGSGNFLYVAINLLLNLEKEVIAYAATHGASLLPQVRPTQLAGIEINPYAQQLAQVVIWIGYLQWMHHNGFNAPRDPILAPIESVRQRDAILDLTDPDNPQEPLWPPADFVVGNPPFLGGKLLRSNLGDEYVEAIFRVWNDRVAKEADLCCYWFEKARSAIATGRSKRAGLLATQGIRGGANRRTLERIKESGDIFFAVSDRDWILDGATVHVSIVGFDEGTQVDRM
jgi:type II restriction/modification system DNA methylase subunit YeeA